MRALEHDAFIARLRAVGAEKYHDKHPFHQAMHDGKLTPTQLRAWVYNRYYYQKCLPIKDAAILQSLPSREKRRRWVRRIVDQDGAVPGEGGIERWFSLARAVGIESDELASERHVHPIARFAVDAYVTFARTQPWLPAVASSLTEMFAPELMTRRIEALAEKYPWIDREGLGYFRARIDVARSDGEDTLAWVCEAADSLELQDECVRALSFKCDVLWALLDGTQLSARPG